jgi:hypothetical protein
MYEWKNHKILKCVGMYELKVNEEIKTIKGINRFFVNSWCYARGKNVWKSWKRRYYALVQVKKSYLSVKEP